MECSAGVDFVYREERGIVARQITLEELQAKMDKVSKQSPELVKKAAAKGTKILAKEARRKYLQVLKRRSGDLYDAIRPLFTKRNGTRIAFAAGVGTKSFGVGRGTRKWSQVYKAVGHELGATRQMPGGQPFFIGDGGRPVYVSKDHPDADNLPKTKPYTITIPRRPFIAPAQKAKLKAVQQQIADELIGAYERG